MTDQTAPKTLGLTPEEWKQLALVNIAQLHGWVSQQPSTTKEGVSALTEEHLTGIDANMDRTRQLLRAWTKSKINLGPQEGAPAPAPTPTANGAAHPKKGGWPKGKPRTRQVKAGQPAQGTA